MTWSSLRNFEEMLIVLYLSILYPIIFSKYYTNVVEKTVTFEAYLHKTLGIVIGQVPLIAFVSIFGLVFLVVGGLLFKRRHGVYGVISVLPFMVMFAHHGSKDLIVKDLAIEDIGTTVLASLTLIFLMVGFAKVGGALFASFKSPVASINCPKLLREKTYPSPVLYTCMLDIIITALFVLMTIAALFTAAQMSWLAILTSLYSVPVIILGLILLRGEKLIGLYLCSVPLAYTIANSVHLYYPLGLSEGLLQMLTPSILFQLCTLLLLVLLCINNQNRLLNIQPEEDDDVYAAPAY